MRLDGIQGSFQNVVNRTRWLLACGSKVFLILSCAVFALGERKNRTRKDLVYRGS
jgi:hypothetical protein